MIKAIIFDLDGVIVDTECLHKEAWEKIFWELKINFNPKVYYKEYMGRSTDEILQSLSQKYNLKEDIRKFKRRKQKYLIRLIKEKLKLIPGAKKLIRRISQSGFRMAIATVANRERVKIIMKKLNLSGYFQAIIAGDQVTQSKPHPEIYLVTAKKLNMDPKDCLVLEDTKAGIESAKNAGMKCIALKHDYNKKSDLIKADLVIDSLKKINIKLIEDL